MSWLVVQETLLCWEGAIYLVVIGVVKWRRGVGLRASGEVRIGSDLWMLDWVRTRRRLIKKCAHVLPTTAPVRWSPSPLVTCPREILQVLVCAAREEEGVWYWKWPSPEGAEGGKRERIRKSRAARGKRGRHLHNRPYEKCNFSSSPLHQQGESTL